MTDDLEDWGSGLQASVDSPSETTAQAGAAFVHIPSWTNIATLDDELERTHRKRGPKRGIPRHVPKRQRLATDTELEEHVAYSIGLDAYGMNEGESGLLADDTEEEAYYQVNVSCTAPCRYKACHNIATLKPCQLFHMILANPLWLG